MNEKSILNLIKSKSNPFKEITDEQKHIKLMSKKIPEIIQMKKELQSKKKTATKNKKPCIDDDTITKRKLRDTLKRGFKNEF